MPGVEKEGRPKYLAAGELKSWERASMIPKKVGVHRGLWPQLRYAANDGLYGAFLNAEAVTRLKAGVVFWREK